jgi:hypothetical protein
VQEVESLKGLAASVARDWLADARTHLRYEFVVGHERGLLTCTGRVRLAIDAAVAEAAITSAAFAM